MIHITLHLQGPLQKYRGEHDPDQPLPVKERQTVGQLLAQIGVPLPAVAFVAVNGSKQPLHRRLQDGDRVVVFPRVSGG